MDRKEWDGWYYDEETGRMHQFQGAEGYPTPQDEPKARPGEQREPERSPNRNISSNPPGNPGL